MDHIHLANQVIEKSAENTKPLYMALIDYEKASDYVLTAAVLEELKDRGIEETYIRFLEDMYKEFTDSKTLHKQSDKFPIRKGVRQGDTISPKLFTVSLEGVSPMLELENIGSRIYGECFSHLRFADYNVLLRETSEHLKTMLEELQSQSMAVGLNMNMKKKIK